MEGLRAGLLRPGASSCTSSGLATSSVWGPCAAASAASVRCRGSVTCVTAGHQPSESYGKFAKALWRLCLSWSASMAPAAMLFHHPDIECGDGMSIVRFCPPRSPL